MCNAIGYVRYTPNNDRESGFPQKVMSALPPKADMCSATGHVRYGPKADMVPSIRNKGLFAIVKMGQILFIFCERDHTAFLFNAGKVFSR
jgi:hypothetical protein